PHGTWSLRSSRRSFYEVNATQRPLRKCSCPAPGRRAPTTSATSAPQGQSPILRKDLAAPRDSLAKQARRPGRRDEPCIAGRESAENETSLSCPLCRADKEHDEPDKEFPEP